MIAERIYGIVADLEQLREDSYDCNLVGTGDKITEAIGPLLNAARAAS